MRKIFLLLFLTMLISCVRDDPRVYIQGIWIATDENSAASSLDFIQWQFSRGSFILQQEVRAGQLMISQGKYDVLENDGNALLVELYNITGDVFTYNNLPVIYKLEINEASGTIRINSREFERVE